MPQQKRNGWAVSLTAEERAEVADLAQRMGGLSYAKLLMFLVRQQLAKMDDSPRPAPTHFHATAKRQRDVHTGWQGASHSIERGARVEKGDKP